METKNSNNCTQSDLCCVLVAKKGNCQVCKSY